MNSEHIKEAVELATAVLLYSLKEHNMDAVQTALDILAQLKRI